MTEWLIILSGFFLKSLRVSLTSDSSNVFLYLKKYQQKCLYTIPLFILFIWDLKPITLANKLVKTVITVKCNVVFFKQWKLNGNHKMYTTVSSHSTDILKTSSSFLWHPICLALFCYNFGFRYWPLIIIHASKYYFNLCKQLTHWLSYPLLVSRELNGLIKNKMFSSLF